MPKKGHFKERICWCNWSVSKAKKQNKVRQWETWWHQFSNGNLEKARKTLYKQKHKKISNIGSNWPIKWKNQKEFKGTFGQW